ncbi:MAG: 3-hydroxyacyl-CoA dehydrogenase [Sphingomonadales bacterium]|jgi:3-hydroxyacyl-CoA dehydrogenase|nr:3-hydroxyacyl-CoA dehydrogenase [Sphingomonadales bacterium]
MEQKPNIAAPEASTDERASSPEFEPVPLRYRTDGWTPAKQREFVEALRDTGVIRQALSRVGLSEQGLGRLRRRPEARAFDLACIAAQRLGVRDRIVSTAYERAIEGTLKGRYYHGELVSEERVYDNRLLMFLIGKLGPVLEPPGESRRVEEDWEGWMEAIETGAPPPSPESEPRPFHERPFDGSEVWEGADGDYWTSFPPPSDFDGREGTGSFGGYERTLTDRELRVIESDVEEDSRGEEARRDRFFGFDSEDEDFGSMEAETSETSAGWAAPHRPLASLVEREKAIAAAAAPVDVYVKPGLSEPDASAGEKAMNPIATHRHGDVLVVTSNNPPVNALGHAVREGLVAAIEQADADEAVKAVVIVCQGQTFFAGADITEFGKPMQMPMLPQVVDRIEACTKPVVAAIHGTAFGGGLEVALASHYRVALPSAKLGVPEVKLGLLPGAGGTQRLPRVAGVPRALEMAATGNPISAKEAYEIGLVDRLIEGDLEQHAVAYAEEVKDVRPIPRASERQDKIEGTDPAVFAEFRKANARKFRGFDAPEYNVRAIEAAVAKPYAEGVQDERRLFMELMSGTQARAQQYFFFAERKASKIDGLPEDTKPRDIQRVGVIGAGTMGGGISMNFLSAGIPVTIVEMQQEALDRGTGVMRKNYEASASKGRITAEQAQGAMGLLKPTLNLEELADCDLIIEAVFENMDVKKEVFGKLDRIAKKGAILASNTSYLNIDEIAASTSRPEDVLGLHFFSPANVMKLLEVVRGAKTAPDVLVTAMQLAKKIRKVAVVAGVCYGFIGNRMLMPRQVQANRLLLEGATPEQIDRVHVEFGMPMGPFQMADLAGVDIGWHRDPTRIENVRDALCAADRWGQKKGAGFYDYDEKRRPSPSPVVAKIIDEFRAKEGVEPRTISDQEIIERTLYTMVNEGAKILEEGMAQRASDIDVVWVYGYGWPVYRGGPMFWADTEGLGKIVDGLRNQQARLGPDFTLSDLLVGKADAGEKFTR